MGFRRRPDSERNQPVSSRCAGAGTERLYHLSQVHVTEEPHRPQRGKKVHTTVGRCGAWWSADLNGRHHAQGLVSLISRSAIKGVRMVDAPLYAFTGHGAALFHFPRRSNMAARHCPRPVGQSIRRLEFGLAKTRRRRSWVYGSKTRREQFIIE
jgi:hypothetical protein